MMYIKAKKKKKIQKQVFLSVFLIVEWLYDIIFRKETHKNLSLKLKYLGTEVNKRASTTLEYFPIHTYYV